MRGLPKFPKEYFQKFKTTPVMVKPLDPKAKEIAQRYIDQKLTAYLLAHPKLLKKYEEVKRKYSYSRREYQIQKDKFLRRVVAEIKNRPA